MSDEVKLLSMDDIFAQSDIEYKTIKIPEWKGEIRIGTLNAEDMIEWTEANEGPAKKTAGLRLIIKSLVDKDGNRIGDLKDLEKWKSRSAPVLNRLVRAILQLNGLTAKVEDVKNDSGEAPIGASPTV